MNFDTKRLSERPDAIAPDGSEVRLLLRLGRGSMAHFRLGPGETAKAVSHRNVEEIWYVLRGMGEMWRKQGELEDTVLLRPETCLTIPAGTHFQFRCLGEEPISVIGVTMPPWPGSDEAYLVDGKW
jgi:mannose-6-phosphate isomerase-like protein (cupin superfamily)